MYVIKYLYLLKLSRIFQSSFHNNLKEIPCNDKGNHVTNIANEVYLSMMHIKWMIQVNLNINNLKIEHQNCIEVKIYYISEVILIILLNNSYKFVSL